MSSKAVGLEGAAAAGAFLAVVLAVFDFFDWENVVGEAYCNVRHPVEAITSEGKTCVAQSIDQRTSTAELIGGRRTNLIWINALERDYHGGSNARLPSKDKPWQEDSDWGNGHLQQAYKMGVYANGYHFVVYDNLGEGRMTLYEWDGASHLTYIVASLFNFVTKEMSYLGYQHLEARNPQWTDAVLGVAVDLAELYVGVGHGILGIAVGTVVNPKDTLRNVPGAIILIVKAIAVGLWNTVADILSLVSLGSVQWQTAAW